MRSHQILSPAGFLGLALLGVCSCTGTASARDSKGRLSSWDNLKSLTAGQEIRVVMNNMKSYQGEFESLSDGELKLREEAGEQTLARQGISRISQRRGQGHRVRNLLIGAAAGAGVGLAIGLHSWLRFRNCTEGPAFGCSYPGNPHLAETLTPSGALAGAAVGAAIPTGRWHGIYRAR